MNSSKSRVGMVRSLSVKWFVLSPVVVVFFFFLFYNTLCTLLSSRCLFLFLSARSFLGGAENTGVEW